MSSLSSSTGAMIASSTSASGGWSLSMSISSLTRMAHLSWSVVRALDRSSIGRRTVSILAEPRTGPVEEEQADVLAAHERGAERLLVPEVHGGELDGDPRHDRQAALGRVGDAGEGVDRRHLERQVEPADAG